MSKSDDNTNELESYGVWVKNSTDTANTPDADLVNELNIDDTGLDLPDFDDSEFSDMFKDDSILNTEETDAFGNEDDTTLSTDELANITSADSVTVEQVESENNENFEDNLSFDSISEEPIFEEEITSNQNETNEETVENTDFNETFDTTTDTEVSLEDSRDFEVSSEDVSFGNDEEISLDDFMDGGFSDESVAAGNNGYEPGAEPGISTTEELSLDDFMDGDTFSDSSNDTQKEEIIEDEAPLDMDLSFDDSVDSIETEDNISLDNTDDFDENSIEEEEEEVQTEEISMSDFTPEIEPEIPVHDVTSDNINTEDIDLSDFGIDANAEETPIVQDVEESKHKDKIVDYDLSVGDENTASAPVVNEIKSDFTSENVSETESNFSETTSNTTSVDNSLLQQIVSELSNLKDEMNKLKSNLAEMKSSDIGVAAAGAATGIAMAAAVKEAQGGFFSEEDDDDTIALSGDELDNIMNTADFEETPADENATADDESINLVSEDAPSFEEIDTETSVSEDEVIDSAASTEDTIFEESIVETTPEESISDNFSDTTIIEDSIPADDTVIEDIEDKPFDFSDEKLEEPEIDNIVTDGDEELYNEDLPDEISIPKEDSLLVESTNSDFMDSVKETTESSEPSDVTDENKPDDDIPTVDKLLSDEPEEESIENSETEVPTTDDFESEDTQIENDTSDEELTSETISEDTFNDSNSEEPVLDDTISSEPEINENLDNEPLLDETSVEESATSDENDEDYKFAEVDNLDNTLSESNLAYLSKDNSDPNGEYTSSLNTDLKQDIKSVLLYMDQLLENLPEEKIVEFAKSNEFVTYKKLFNELGLS